MMAVLFLLQALKKEKKKLLKAHNVPFKKRCYFLQFHKTFHIYIEHSQG